MSDSWTNAVVIDIMMMNKKSEVLWKNRPGKIFHLYNARYMNGIVPMAVSIKYMLIFLLVWYSGFRSVSFSRLRNRIMNPENAIIDSVVFVFSGRLYFSSVRVVSKVMNSIMYFPVAFAVSESVCDISKWHDSSW